MIELIWFQLGVFFFLCLLFWNIVKKGKASFSKVSYAHSMIDRELTKRGWERRASTFVNGAWVALYKNGVKKRVVLVCEKDSLGFEEFKKSVVMALFSKSREIHIYSDHISLHVHKAMTKINSNRRVHKLRITVISHNYSARRRHYF